MAARIFAFFTSLFMLLCSFLHIPVLNGKYSFSIDTSSLSDRALPNLASNVNVWDMGKSFWEPKANEENNVFDFVEYVQLMQCSGGSYERDLFTDPRNSEILDDYDFGSLIKNCRGILSLGAKPCLKLGGVPMKYTGGETDVSGAGFANNINPPDDYKVYYNYIYALASALVEEFGAEEVLKWHFGVMTEYENPDWFIAKSGDAMDTAREYCKLYDYTVGALQAAIGENVYVGAHSMTVTEGLWDEAYFIKHCASGRNYCTGEKGTRICCLSASFYDSRPAVPTSGKTLPETILYLKNTAEKYGLEGLDYGIDEGRILSGNSSGAETDQILSRSSGFTWQGAYDARGYSQLMDTGAGYFSYWYYLSDGLFKGNPTISYHVSRLISGYKGLYQAAVEGKTEGAGGAEVNFKAAVDKESGKIKLFGYNFKNDLGYKKSADVSLKIKAKNVPDGEVSFTLYRIDDDCNWFDEWCEDRKTYNITDDCFLWSPDDGCLSFLTDETAKNLYYGELINKYKTLSQLVPSEITGTAKDGVITLNIDIEANTAVFLETK